MTKYIYKAADASYPYFSQLDFTPHLSLPNTQIARYHAPKRPVKTPNNPYGVIVTIGALHCYTTTKPYELIVINPRGDGYPEKLTQNWEGEFFIYSHLSKREVDKIMALVIEGTRSKVIHEVDICIKEYLINS